MPSGKTQKQHNQFTSPESSFPEVIGYIVVIGRSSDLSLFANAFPELFSTFSRGEPPCSRYSSGWYFVCNLWAYAIRPNAGFTAAGTVRDFHTGSLFIARCRMTKCKTNSGTKIIVFLCFLFYLFFI